MRRLPLFTSSALPASPFARRAPRPTRNRDPPAPHEPPRAAPSAPSTHLASSHRTRAANARSRTQLPRRVPLATAPRHCAHAPTKATRAFAPVANPLPARRLGPAAPKCASAAGSPTESPRAPHLAGTTSSSRPSARPGAALSPPQTNVWTLALFSASNFTRRFSSPH
jgi:hypothetical protein